MTSLKDAINEDIGSTQVHVPGIGIYSYETLKRNVREKLADMLTRLDEDDIHTIGDSQMKVLSSMWVALGKVTDDR